MQVELKDKLEPYVDVFHFPRAKKGKKTVSLEIQGPVEHWHNDSSTMCANQLGFIDSNSAGRIHHVGKLVKRRNKVHFIRSLDESEAAIWSKFSVPSNKKRIVHRFVELKDCSPR